MEAQNIAKGDMYGIRSFPSAPSPKHDSSEEPSANVKDHMKRSEKIIADL